ncbi:MAG: IS110 family transposase, partial [Mycobacterium sp.]
RKRKEPGTMEHIAIDVGGRESQICVRHGDGTIVEERRCPTDALKANLARRAKGRVILETCAEGFAIADAALAHGHEVRVVPATLVRSLGVGSRGVKTDRRDAQLLSEVSCRINLPSVHIPSLEARQRKAICGMREILVGCRTRLVNSVRGWLRTQGKRPRTGAVRTFPRRVRALYGHESAPVPSFVERQLATIEQLTTQIIAAGTQVAELARTDATCRRLMSVPGVGPVTAVRFVAALDQVDRFPDAHAVESYLGLVPGEHSSSDHRRRTTITKAGSPQLRWTLVQAALCARRRRKDDPMVAWSRQVELRRGRHIATIALARKLAGILYALWRDGSTYDPNHHEKEVRTGMTLSGATPQS